MEHLRLTEKNHSTQPEYYITDSHATDHIAHFVGNIKQLNILVGANNTRKSRFIRQIINLEQKIVFNSQLRLNEHLQLSDKLFDQMENLGKEEFLIELHVDDLPYAHQPNPIYQVVKTLLGLKSGYSLILRPETFERTIARLKSQLENAVETDDLDIIPDLFSALELLLELQHKSRDIFMQLLFFSYPWCARLVREFYNPMLNAFSFCCTTPRCNRISRAWPEPWFQTWYGIPIPSSRS
jgi:hypothetical protein